MGRRWQGMGHAGTRFGSAATPPRKGISACRGEMADDKLDPLRGELQEAIERAQRQLGVKIIRQGDLVDDAIGLLTKREVIGEVLDERPCRLVCAQHVGARFPYSPLVSGLRKRPYEDPAEPKPLLVVDDGDGDLGDIPSLWRAKEMGHTDAIDLLRFIAHGLGTDREVAGSPSSSQQTLDLGQ